MERESTLIELSICIPTNGVSEWVFPVLDSIYVGQISSLNQFEVIVTDNGGDDDFQKKMSAYQEKYSNLIYKKTTAYQFLNQIEAFKLARGKFIRFLNHRMTVSENFIKDLLDFVAENEKEKPCIYFMNRAQKKKQGIETYYDFDGYVRGLLKYSSWSAGLAMWKSDFEQMNLEKPFNTLFPHTDLLFFVTKRKRYIINHMSYAKELPIGTIKKGAYDLFEAFSIEYPMILIDLARKNLISWETFCVVKKDIEDFLATQYVSFLI